jgi:hypothetical protein
MRLDPEHEQLLDGVASQPEFELTVQLNDVQAWNLAQFVKRVCWTDIRSCAVDDDEAYAMRDAIDRLQIALREAGFAPR